MLTEESFVVRKQSADVALPGNKKPVLSHLDIELTERCNNNCIHCCINLPAADAAARARETGGSQVSDILKQAAGLGCLTVRFTGGEPLLRQDFEELYLRARRLGMKVIISTNGTLITPRLADLLAHIPPLEPLEITVYGIKRESYEAVTRVPGTFEIFWRGVHLLLERRVPFAVKHALLTPQNMEEIDAFEAFAKSLPSGDKTPAYVVSLDLRARRDSPQANRRLKALRLAPEKLSAMYARRGERYLGEMRAFCSRFTRPEGDRLFPCDAGQGTACVDSYGNFQMCLELRHPETTISGVTLSKALARFTELRDLRAKNPDYLARCARCFLKGLCEQCPAKSWMEHGTLDTPVGYLCRIARAEARHLGLLTGEENAWEVTDWRERIERFTAGPATV